MNNQKRLCVMAALALAVVAAGGCAGIQTTRLTTPPDFAAIEHTADLANVAATRTVRDSRSLVTQTAVEAQSDARIAALRPAVATVAADAAQTYTTTTATVAALKPALRQQAVFVNSARAVEAGEMHNAARYHAISNSLSYKLGRFIVVTVFLLLVAGGLIIFSESGLADVLAVKWPILASMIFKPVGYLGTLLGKLWGYVESGLAAVWHGIARNLMPTAATLS